MERTVPTTESEEVELYLRTYYSLLRTTAEVQIRTLEEVHAGMNSLLHAGARSEQVDMSAFIYSMLRLPACISDTHLVVLGQSADVFARGGYANVFHWEQVSATARRRRCFFNGKDTLACFIASRSDIDDIIPLLTAYQIEWNKFNRRLRRLPESLSLPEICNTVSGCAELVNYLEISEDDFERLFAIWDENLGQFLQTVAAAPLRLRVQLLNGSFSEYRRATHAWWSNIEKVSPHIYERPVYFVSSNTHSLLNLLSGFPLLSRAELLAYLELSENAGLLLEWNDIITGKVRSSQENFLYYIYKKYIQSPAGRALAARQVEHEESQGIKRIRSDRYFDVEAQVFELASVRTENIDPRLVQGSLSGLEGSLKDSDALILNIDYPLGLAAYNILTEVAEHVGSVLGVYFIGKAATLNGVVGDIMMPNVIHDEHSQNTFLFPNSFCASDVAPYLVYGAVLDNQKAVTVQGTFLQNARYMDVFYREGYTDIEMEAGPYLSAVYEMFRPKRHPMNEIVNLYGLPFDLGLIHYASDTPLSKGKNLGAGSLSYFGMDSTYAASIAVLRRILHLERQRLHAA